MNLKTDDNLKIEKKLIFTKEKKYQKYLLLKRRKNYSINSYRKKITNKKWLNNKTFDFFKIKQYN